MERLWVVGEVAVSVALVDFLDPELAGSADARERGVRLEVRRVQHEAPGSIYSSPRVVLAPALLRVDLLESGPGASDRMHWHPTMTDGEPGDRTFDPAIVDDPLGWTHHLLTHLHDHVGHDAADELAACADAVVREVGTVLERSREPWPEVTHDERGLAPTWAGRSD